MVKHAVKVGWGVLLCLVGIAGIILPIMPGWIFLIPGLLILSEYVPPIKRLVDWLHSKMPKHVAWKKGPVAWKTGEKADEPPDR